MEGIASLSKSPRRAQARDQAGARPASVFEPQVEPDDRNTATRDLVRDLKSKTSDMEDNEDVRDVPLDQFWELLAQMKAREAAAAVAVANAAVAASAKVIAAETQAVDAAPRNKAQEIRTRARHAVDAAVAVAEAARAAAAVSVSAAAAAEARVPPKGDEDAEYECLANSGCASSDGDAGSDCSATRRDGGSRVTSVSAHEHESDEIARLDPEHDSDASPMATTQVRQGAAVSLRCGHLSVTSQDNWTAAAASQPSGSCPSFGGIESSPRVVRAPASGLHFPSWSAQLTL